MQGTAPTELNGCNVSYYSREPHRSAALGARWMNDVLCRWNDFKLAHGDTRCQCRRERERPLHHRCLPHLRSTILKDIPRSLHGSVRNLTHVDSWQRMSAIGTKRTSVCIASMSALEVSRHRAASPECPLLTQSGYASSRIIGRGATLFARLIGRRGRLAHHRRRRIHT